MPKKVDHDQRRHEISRAAAHIAATRGLQAVSFREVAAEADVSVSLVQHYFGAKDQLLIDTLDLQSGAIGKTIVDRLSELGPDAHPLARVATILHAFLPRDDESRNAMLLYLGYAGAALTDPSLRRADAFRNADALRSTIAQELHRASMAGELANGVDPHAHALAMLSTVLGLSMAILLEQVTIGEADYAIDEQMALLGASRWC